MAGFRDALPQSGPEIFLTDSGIETDLIFNHGIDLPQFAAFPLLDDEDGVDRLVAYYTAHLDVAAAAGVGFVLEAPTWRANADWGALLGYDAAALAGVNAAAIDLMLDLRRPTDRAQPISGCIGPRADAYRPAQLMTAADARDVSPCPGRDLRRHRGGPGHRDDPDLRRGGDRYRAGRS